MWLRALLLLLASWLSSNAAVAGVTWLTAVDQAIVRAQEGKKPLLVHLRGDCGRCNDRLDTLLAAAETHEPILHAYDSFVLSRVELEADLGQLQTFGFEKLQPPFVALVTSGGMYVTSTDTRDLDEYASFLNRARGQAARLRSMDELLQQGKKLDAQMVAARIVLSIGDFSGAKFLFNRTRSDFAAAGDDQKAELAGIESDYAAAIGTINQSTRSTIALRLRTTADRSAFPANAAEAYLRVGFLIKSPRYATEDFRLALERAQPGSESWKIAAQWLIARGEIVKSEPPKRPTIRIVKPERATLTGRVELQAECASNVARVAWFQDGVAVGSDASAPFSARVNLGSVPRLHAIQARAYDARGEAVGVAEVAINDRVDAFRVSIVAPAASAVSGEVVVEAEAQAPAGTRVLNVALLWNEKTIVTLAAPPYRATFNVPQEFGFIRAVATLDDGRIAEETKPVNEREFSMPVNVHEIVFPVTVVDRKGPIAGLGPDDFIVKDEGLRVPVTFQPDEGSTIGLAIDSSTSMSSSLLETMEMTAEVIASAVTPADKAFLMAFDDRPYMIQMATADADRLRRVAFDLTPVGATSLFDAIAFGLQQFTGLPGKRALVVITDGLDVYSNQGAGSCTRMAREIGVPVYVVVTAENRMSPNQRGLETIANGTGGGIFSAPTREEQRKIFQRIRDEVRGQYLLTFPAPAAKAGSWRTIRVEVPRAKANVRTIVGYYAR